MTLLLRWLDEQPLHVSEAGITEQSLYGYVSSLRAEGPATRAQGAIEAVSFAKSAVGLDVDLEAVLSARVRGAALSALDRKRLARKAPPLPVLAVEALELATVAGDDPKTRVLCGFLCLLVYGRGRCRDISAISCEPTLDMADDDHGYLELVAASTKTSHGVKKRRPGLPVAALARGVSRDVGPWAPA